MQSYNYSFLFNSIPLKYVSSLSSKLIMDASSWYDVKGHNRSSWKQCSL